MHLGDRKSFTEKDFISSMASKTCAEVWTFMQMSFHSSTSLKVSPLARFHSSCSNKVGGKQKNSLTFHHFRSLRWVGGGIESLPELPKYLGKDLELMSPYPYKQDSHRQILWKQWCVQTLGSYYIFHSVWVQNNFILSFIFKCN